MQIVLRAPKANAISERVIGMSRRECLDWLIPLSESHLRSMLKVWVPHYNVARPHVALGPRVPNPSAGAVLRVDEKSRHHPAATADRGKKEPRSYDRASCRSARR